MKKQRKPLLVRIRNVALLVGGCMIVTSLLCIRLTADNPRLLPAEVTMLGTSTVQNFKTSNFLNLPLRLLQIPAKLPMLGNTAPLARLPSILLGVISFLFFMHISRRWYGRRSMLLGCLMFVTSAWFLHVSRAASVDIEFLAGILALLVIHVGLYDHDKSRLMLFVWLGVNMLLLYIPGFVWFVLLSFVWQWRVFVTAWQNLVPFWLRLLWCAVAAIGVGPIVYMLIRQPWLLRSWLGLPTHFDSWRITLQHVGTSFSAFVYRGPTDPQLWLDHLPILDACVTALVVLGVIFYAMHWRAARTRLLLGYIVLGAMLVGLQGGVRLSVMIPLIYLVAVGGLAYALFLWLRHFPQNGLARTVGTVGVVLLVGLSCAYNLQAYFVAWPHNPDTSRLISIQ